MKKKYVSVIVTSALAILGWCEICDFTGKAVGKGVKSFIGRNPKSRGRQFAGGVIIGLFMAIIHFLGKYLGGMVGKTMLNALEYETQAQTTKPADMHTVLNTEEDVDDDDDEDIWEPSIEMEPKMSQV